MESSPIQDKHENTQVESKLHASALSTSNNLNTSTFSNDGNEKLLVPKAAVTQLITKNNYYKTQLAEVLDALTKSEQKEKSASVKVEKITGVLNTIKIAYKELEEKYEAACQVLKLREEQQISNLRNELIEGKDFSDSEEEENKIVIEKEDKKNEITEEQIEELKNLQQKIQLLETENAQLKEEVVKGNESQSVVEKILAENEELKQENKEMATDTIEIATKNEEYQKAIEELTIINNNDNIIIEQQNSEIQKLNKIIVEKQQIIDDMEIKETDYRARLAAKDDIIQSEIYPQLKTQTDKLTDIKNKVEYDEKLIASFETKLSNIITVDIAQKDNTIEELYTNYKDLYEEFVSYKLEKDNEINDLVTVIQKQEEELETLKEKEHNYIDTINKKEQYIDNLVETNRTNKEDSKVLIEENEDNKKSIKFIQKESKSNNLNESLIESVNNNILRIKTSSGIQIKNVKDEEDDYDEKSNESKSEISGLNDTPDNNNNNKMMYNDLIDTITSKHNSNDINQKCSNCINLQANIEEYQKNIKDKDEQLMALKSVITNQELELKKIVRDNEQSYDTMTKEYSSQVKKLEEHLIEKTRNYDIIEKDFEDLKIELSTEKSLKERNSEQYLKEKEKLNKEKELLETQLSKLKTEVYNTNSQLNDKNKVLEEKEQLLKENITKINELTKEIDKNNNHLKEIETNYKNAKEETILLQKRNSELSSRISELVLQKQNDDQLNKETSLKQQAIFDSYMQNKEIEINEKKNIIEKLQNESSIMKNRLLDDENSFRQKINDLETKNKKNIKRLNKKFNEIIKEYKKKGIDISETLKRVINSIDSIGLTIVTLYSTCNYSLPPITNFVQNTENNETSDNSSKIKNILDITSNFSLTDSSSILSTSDDELIITPINYRFEPDNKEVTHISTINENQDKENKDNSNKKPNINKIENDLKENTTFNINLDKLIKTLNDKVLIIVSMISTKSLSSLFSEKEEEIKKLTEKNTKLFNETIELHKNINDQFDIIENHKERDNKNKAAIKIRDNEITQLKQKLLIADENISQTNNSIIDLKAQLTKLNEIIQDLTNQLNDEKVSNKILTEEHEKILKDKYTIQEQLKESEETSHILKSTIDSIKSQLNNKNQEISLMQSTINKQYSEKIEKIEKQIKEKEIEISQLNIQLSIVKQANEKLANERELLSSTIETKGKEFNILNTKLQDQKEEFDRKLYEETQKFYTQKIKAENQLQQLQNEIDVNITEIEEAKKVIENYEEKLKDYNQLQNLIHTLKNDYDKVVSENQSLKNEYTNMKTIIENYKNNLLDKNNRDFSDNNEEKQKENIKNLQENLKKALLDIQNLQTKLAEKESINNNIIAFTGKIQNKLRLTESELQKIRRDYGEKENEILTLQLDYDEFKANSIKIQKELDEMKYKSKLSINSINNKTQTNTKTEDINKKIEDSNKKISNSDKNNITLDKKIITETTKAKVNSQTITEAPMKVQKITVSKNRDYERTVVNINSSNTITNLQNNIENNKNEKEQQPTIINVRTATELLKVSRLNNSNIDQKNQINQDSYVAQIVNLDGVKKVSEIEDHKLPLLRTEKENGQHTKDDLNLSELNLQTGETSITQRIPDPKLVSSNTVDVNNVNLKENLITNNFEKIINHNRPSSTDSHSNRIDKSINSSLNRSYNSILTSSTLEIQNNLHRHLIERISSLESVLDKTKKNVNELNKYNDQIQLAQLSNQFNNRPKSAPLHHQKNNQAEHNSSSSSKGLITTQTYNINNNNSNSIKISSRNSGKKDSNKESKEIIITSNRNNFFTHERKIVENQNTDKNEILRMSSTIVPGDLSIIETNK